jgi:hypothetical protein
LQHASDGSAAPQSGCAARQHAIGEIISSAAQLAQTDAASANVNTSEPVTEFRRMVTSLPGCRDRVNFSHELRDFRPTSPIPGGGAPQERS